MEFGAGKGTLSLVVAEAMGGRARVCLVDTGSFRSKADAHMRHMQLVRARCDIKDFNPAGVDILEARRSTEIGSSTGSQRRQGRRRRRRRRGARSTGGERSDH